MKTRTRSDRANFLGHWRRRLSFSTALLALLVSASFARAEFQGFKDKQISKPDAKIVSETSISRKRVTINQKTTERQSPVITQLQDIEFEKARKFKVDEKTNELIGQLETLVKRPGQQSRVGELKMRLAELYYERGQSIAAQESEEWETALKKWEALPEAARAKSARPLLNTPKADAYRKRTLHHYQDLEKMSRGPDRGKSQSIRREEVLFFLASTMMDVGSRKGAVPYYEELVKQYSSGERAYAARLNLADLYFETGRYDAAVGPYLEVAAGNGAPKTEDAQHLKAYGLYKLGWCYMNLGKHDKAVLAFKKTIEVSKNSSNERRIVLEKEALNDLARAFALSGQFDEGEKYFSAQGEAGEEGLTHFRIEAAAISRDNGNLDLAIKYYGQLVAQDPKSERARDYALERLQLIGKRPNVKAYQAAIEDFAKNYGADSSWLTSRSAEEQRSASEELVALLRREAKNTHRNAQQKDSGDLYEQARGYYQLYFKFVPAPNKDTTDNQHEMKFYYAELLYKMGRYEEAAHAYENVGAGKYAATASYSRILSLKLGAKKNKELTKELIAATDQFVAQFPSDARAGDLLYSTAQEAFNAGDNKESIAALEKVVEKFPDQPMGAEAAERILFISEKEGDIDGAVAKSSQFLSNPALLKAGGKDFEKRLREMSSRAEFKKAESVSGDDSVKAAAFLTLAKKSQGELKEKSLNNAVVFGKKGNNDAVVKEAQKILIAEFPNSAFAKGVYFDTAAAQAESGSWKEALAAYSAYLKTFDGKKTSETEAAEWNRLYIKASLEDVWFAELYPDRAPSADVLKMAHDFIESYPKSSHREAIVEMLAFKKGNSELAKLHALHGLSSRERNTLAEAEVIQDVRANKNTAAIVKKYPPSRVSSNVMKHALALSAFRLIDPQYKAYQAQKINYSPKKFAPTLQAKLKSLELLEKQYMGVVAYGNGEWALKSLDRLSGLYRTLAADIEKAPAPKEELKQFSTPLYEKGVGFLKTCLEKAAELKIGGEGVATCRTTASRIGAGFVTLTDEILPQPKWLPTTDGLVLQPLVKSGIESLRQGHYGEANLVQELIAKGESKAGASAMQADDELALELIRGLTNFHYKAYDVAVKNFRRASESLKPSLKAAALKNLTALYIEVSDFNQAADVIAGLEGGDAEAMLLSGLAARGKGDNSSAVADYGLGLEKSPNNTDLLFNKALAHAALGQFDEAAKAMNRYIEMQTPSQNHISRDLLKRYKQNSEEKQ